jgi:hypothetical protein
MCPHTTMYVSAYHYSYVSSCYYVCVRIPLCVRIPIVYYYVSSYYYVCVRIPLYICVLILLHMCPHTTICVLILLCMCPCVVLQMCVLILLYMFPHTTIGVLTQQYVCSHTTKSVCSFHYVCPHTMCVSSYYYMCVLITPPLKKKVADVWQQVRRDVTRAVEVCSGISDAKRRQVLVIYMCPHTIIRRDSPRRSLFRNQLTRSAGRY